MAARKSGRRVGNQPSDTARGAAKRAMGAWPAAGSTEGAVFDRYVRPRIQAVKFVAVYRTAWDAIEAAVGRPATLSALQRLREGMPGADEPAMRALGAFDPHVLLLDVPTVDPYDLEDFGPPPELADGHRLPAWVTRNLAVQLGASPHPHRPDTSNDYPFVQATIDLSAPWSDLRRVLELFKREYGVRERRRPERLADWRDRLCPAFELTRHIELHPGQALSGLARTHLGWKGDDANGARRVRELLALARGRIDFVSWTIDEHLICRVRAGLATPSGLKKLIRAVPVRVRGPVLVGFPPTKQRMDLCHVCSLA